MFELGEGGKIIPMGKAPQTLTSASLPHSHCTHSHHHHTIQSTNIPTTNIPTSNSIVQQYPSASLNTSLEKRQQLQAQVFQPGWRQPTETLDEYVDRMMPHAITGGGNEPTEEDLEREAREKEELIERDDEENLRKERDWDEYKDDNPTGSGNRLGQG
jgi:hypothetical protein